MLILKNKKILVAGSSGFLGNHVLKILERTDRFEPLGFSLDKKIDFRDFKQVNKLFEKEKFDAVINCAAFVGGIQFGLEKPGEIFYSNILMATNLMEVARLHNIKRFINPISNCSYPANLNIFREDQWWDGPLDESVLVYGSVRKLSWVQSFAYQKQYGFDTINLILPNMYGPGDYFDEKRSHALGALIMKFVEAKRRDKREVIIWGSGKPIREWLYVGDGAQALVKSLSIKPIINPINIGVGKGISIAALALFIKKETGYKGKILFDHSRPDGAPCKIMNNKKMKSIFNWEPPTDLETGIRETIQWYIKNR